MRKTSGGTPAGLAALLACSLALSGCVASASRTKRQPGEGKSRTGSENETPYVPGVEVTEASLRGSQFTAVSELETIHFDYDSATLSDDALGVLKSNAVYLKAHDELQFRVAGYCDERGTVEYNLALGQKRAKSVREYYIRLGVPGASVATISYGKEAPTCSESADDCWAQNRRAETGVRSRTPASAPTPPAGDAP
jgi:peptidoglycan-associated lipoprotein